MSLNSKKLNTAYQRAKAKAERLDWQPVEKTGLVAVAEILKNSAILKSDPGLQEKMRLTLNTANSLHNTSGYPFRQTSTRKSNGGYTVSFQFYSAKANSQFVVKAFYYEKVDIFMIKFFNKSSRSLIKYGTRTNRGDVRAILRTNFDILTYLSTTHPHASFGFMGERSYFITKFSHHFLLEQMANNQRFRIYRQFLHQPANFNWLIQRFELSYIEELSTCLLINKNSANANAARSKEKQVIDFFSHIYPELNFSRF